MLPMKNRFLWALLAALLLLTSCQNDLAEGEETFATTPLTEAVETTESRKTSPEKTETKEEAMEETKESAGWENGTFDFTLIGGTKGDNDGAAWGGYLFKFSGSGWCYIYKLGSFSEMAGQIWKRTGEKTKLSASFKLDRSDEYTPHSNAVFFGTEKYSPEDEFPLLYCNVYNSFKNEADQQRGVLCAYRITRSGDKFSSQLVQLIQVGFTDDSTLWVSEYGKDVRPYGNFALDRDTNTLYAYTMRDEDKSTRYFSFSMPSVGEGEMDASLGVPRAILQKEDILTKFSCPYHHYIQGAEISNGYLFSVEGRTENKDHPAVLRIISLKEQKQVRQIFLRDFVLDIEPEVITFWDGKCYYADVRGNTYLMECTE